LLEKARAAERERERQLREEAERRRKKRQKRRLEKEARIERFNSLVGYWRKTRERRAFLEHLRQAIGAVDAESPLAKWLIWAEAYVEGSDPLERFRTRKQTVKLYFSGYKYQIERIKEHGFEDSEPSDYQRDKYIPGIILRDRRPAVDSLEELLEFDLPEDLILPYEVTEPGYEPRTFHVPARVLNKCMNTVTSAAPHDPESAAVE
jgi:hypothetical protein